MLALKTAQCHDFILLKQQRNFVQSMSCSLIIKFSNNNESSNWSLQLLQLPRWFGTFWQSLTFVDIFGIMLTFNNSFHLSNNYMIICWSITNLLKNTHPYVYIIHQYVILYIKETKSIFKKLAVNIKLHFIWSKGIVEIQIMYEWLWSKASVFFKNPVSRLYRGNA